MHRSTDAQKAQKHPAPRKRKQGMSGLMGTSGDAPVMSALNTPPPQQAFNHQQQLPNAALAVGSGICPPPPFIMAAPVVILSPSSVPTITATQPRIIPHHSLPQMEHSPFQPQAGFGLNPSAARPPPHAAFGTSFHGPASSMERFNHGVIQMGPPSFNGGIPSLLQPRPQTLLTYARGDSSLQTAHSIVHDESTPPFPLEHMIRPQQGGRRPGMVISPAEHERVVRQLEMWQEGRADTPPQQHPVSSSVVSVDATSCTGRIADHLVVCLWRSVADWGRTSCREPSGQGYHWPTGDPFGLVPI